MILINKRGSPSFDSAARLFQSALDLAQVTQTSQKAWATTYLNLGTCHRKLKYAPISPHTRALLCSWHAKIKITFPSRRLDDARAAYQRVLELEPRHAVALGFLGMVQHLMGNLDAAIVKYHEVRLSPTPSHPPSPHAGRCQFLTHAH